MRACEQVFAGHEDEVTCGMFTSNGRSVVTGSLDGTCRVWNPKDGTCRHQFQGYQWHETGIISMDVHPTQPLVATGALDGSVRISQVRKGKILCVVLVTLSVVVFCVTAAL